MEQRFINYLLLMDMKNVKSKNIGISIFYNFQAILKWACLLFSWIKALYNASILQEKKRDFYNNIHTLGPLYTPTYYIISDNKTKNVGKVIYMRRITHVRPFTPTL